MQKSRTNPWLVTTIVLAVALVALGVWTMIDRQTNQPLGLASDEVKAILEDRIATLNAEGGFAAAAFYADDAIFEDHDEEPSVVTTEAEHIGPHLEDAWNMGMRLKSASTPIQVGHYAAEALVMVGPDAVSLPLAEALALPEARPGMAVYQLDANGKIVHQWYIADVEE